DGHLDDTAGAAAVLPGAARIRPEFMCLEEQGGAHFGDFEAAEFDPAGGLPFTAAGPAIAGRGRAAAGPRLKEMPDKRLAAGPAIRPGRAWVLALDRDAEPAAPAGHRALRTGRCQRLDDRLDDFLAAMIGRQSDRRAGISPDDRAGFGDDVERAEGAVVFGRVRVD